VTTRRESIARAQVAIAALLACVGLSLLMPCAAWGSPFAADSPPANWHRFSANDDVVSYEFTSGTRSSMTFTSVFAEFYGPSGQRAGRPTPQSFQEFKNQIDTQMARARNAVAVDSLSYRATTIGDQLVWRCDTSVTGGEGTFRYALLFNPSNGGGTYVTAGCQAAGGAMGDGTLARSMAEVEHYINSLRFRQNPSANGGSDAMRTAGLAARSGDPGVALKVTAGALKTQLTGGNEEAWPIVLGWMAALAALACAVAGLAFSVAIEGGRGVGPRTHVGFALRVSARRLKVGRDEARVFTANAWRVLGNGTPEAATDVTVSVEPPDGVTATSTSGAGTLRTTLLQTDDVRSPAHLVVTATGPTGGTRTTIALEAE
jgi:hypothetical protein